MYFALFSVVLDRPLSLGLLRQELDAKLQRGAALRGPKLVLLAGSNGPYSHRCETIEQLLGRPCVNGGVAVGVGLDYLFARWQPLLHQGDTVYLPMEETQYARSRAETAVGPDASIMMRHDWGTLALLSPDRWAGAAFSADLRSALMSLIEMALIGTGFHDPRAEVAGSSNAWGDHVGHTALLAEVSRTAVKAAHPVHASAEAVRNGYGTSLIAAFLVWAQHNGVRVVGGLPTGFEDSPIPDDELEAIRSVYRSHGAAFLELPNRSRYPRAAFFDTPDHLNETWQRIHSAAVARALAEIQPDRKFAERVFNLSQPQP